MFVSRVLKGKYGRWSDRALNFMATNKLGPSSGLKFGYVTIEDKKVYDLFVSKFCNEIESENLGYAVFQDSQLMLARKLVYLNTPFIVYPAMLNEDEDGLDYLRFAFGETCGCLNNIPIGEQIRPFIFEKEPRLGKNYLWGSFYGASGYLITDIARYKLLKNKWGFEKREVLIGKNKRISKNFVQVNVPIAESKLCFGDSKFAITFKNDDSGEFSENKEVCSSCNTPLYTNQIHDYFPDFKSPFEFNAVFTQEWFSNKRYLVVSSEFASWAIENKYSKLNSFNFIPVKKFC